MIRSFKYKILIIPTTLTLALFYLLAITLLKEQDTLSMEERLFIEEKEELTREKILLFEQKEPLKQYYRYQDTEESIGIFSAASSQLRVSIQNGTIEAQEFMNSVSSFLDSFRSGALEAHQELITDHATLSYKTLTLKTAKASLLLTPPPSSAHSIRTLSLQADELLCHLSTKSIFAKKPQGQLFFVRDRPIDFQGDLFTWNQQTLQGGLKGAVLVKQEDNYLTSSELLIKENELFAEGETFVTAGNFHITHTGTTRYSLQEHILETVDKEPIYCRQEDALIKAGKARLIYDPELHAFDQLELLQGVEISKESSFAKGERLLYSSKTQSGLLEGKREDKLFFYDKEKKFALETDRIYIEKDQYKVDGKAHIIVDPNIIKNHLPEVQWKKPVK